MEPYYYSKMNKVQQTAYHAIRQGLLEISDSIQIPGMEAEELYNVFSVSYTHLRAHET